MPSFVDVARLAGVSTATVSRVLNSHPSVRPETRQRVERAMQAVNYRVSAAARSLRTAETRQVLALVPDLSHAFYADVLRGITNVAHDNDYEVLLCETLSLTSHNRVFARMLDSHRYDGVITMSPKDSKRLLGDVMLDIPSVACLESLPDAPMAHVSIDDRLAAKDAVLYLLAKGHRRIGLVNVNERALYASLRRTGYREALREAGLAEREDYVQIVDALDYQLGELATRRLLALEDRPTAVFAVSDTLAVGAIKAAMAAGLRVPEDLAVVGFDDVPLASAFEPSLTTVAQPRRQIGEQAMGLLLQRIKGGNPQSLMLSHSLIVRRSA